MIGFKRVYAPVKISDMVFHTKLGFVNHSMAASDSVALGRYGLDREDVPAAEKGI
ncbi:MULTISPECIES: hypothetical protein [Aminobacter]|jgi:hypothetical protein|uniref:hypothetical protein n=1 Tax=Aminobacter TaxID=31988 RepID=UPI00130FDA21|nr:hypothetical protein [Aminobacter ciceronei]MRX36406.1 hypothetical protein [Aminobacter sp. MDW-2]